MSPHCDSDDIENLCPACADWVRRINDGACRAAHTDRGLQLAGGSWEVPWVRAVGTVAPFTDEGRASYDGDAGG